MLRTYAWDGGKPKDNSRKYSNFLQTLEQLPSKIGLQTFDDGQLGLNMF
jgi:hypothetical protein